MDAADSIPSGFSETLRPDLVRHVAVGRRDAATLVRAAVREAFEESGALLAAGRPGRAGPPAAPLEPADPLENVWQAYRRLELTPAFAAIALVGRAITPTSSPRRYNTHFFLADATPFPGTIIGNGELEDLAWWPLGKIQNLGLVDVTEFMLAEALALWRAGLKRPAGARPPLLTYVGDAVRVRR